MDFADSGAFLLTIELTVIMTERLRCEPVRGEHAEAMYPTLLDHHIYKFIPGEPPASVAALRLRFNSLSSGRSPDGNEVWLNWMLFQRSSENPIGYFQATVRRDGCSVAYVLNPCFWKQGYATEAADAILTLLFQKFEIRSITAEINPQNEASQRLVKRLGFAFVRHNADDNDDIFEISRADWFRHALSPDDFAGHQAV